MELAALLQRNGGKVQNAGGGLAEADLFSLRTLEDALMREWEIDPSQVHLLEKIGEGEFGKVYRVRRCRPLKSEHSEKSCMVASRAARR